MWLYIAIYSPLLSLLISNICLRRACLCTVSSIQFFRDMVLCSAEPNQDGNVVELILLFVLGTVNPEFLNFVELIE